MNYNLNSEHRAGGRIQPGPNPTVAQHIPMTVNGLSEAQRAAQRQQEAQRPSHGQPETPMTLAFQGYEQAVAAHCALNAEADAQFNCDAPTLTEAGWRERKAEIRNSPAATIVDISEAAVKARQAESRERYKSLIAGLVVAGDGAQEQRNTRYSQRVQRQLDAARDTSEKIRIAQTLMETADRSQRGVLAEELPSYFAGDTGWIDATWQQVDPEIAAAVQDRKLADQSAAMSNYAANSVRRGFETGSPPTQIGKLAAAAPKYDPDQNR